LDLRAISWKLPIVGPLADWELSAQVDTYECEWTQVVEGSKERLQSFNQFRTGLILSQ
jgi:hypothetical protein